MSDEREKGTHVLRGVNASCHDLEQADMSDEREQAMNDLLEWLDTLRRPTPWWMVALYVAAIMATVAVCAMRGCVR